MPGTAGKGMSTNSMKIAGSIDTSLIERGFTRIKQGFENVQGVAKGFAADQQRMVQGTKQLAKGLIRVGIVGAAAITTLAQGAPAVAPAMARITVGLMKLKFAAGEALAPAFEKVAGWLDKFAAWSSDNPKLFSGMLISLTAIAGLKFLGAMGLVKALGTLLISPAVLTALGYLAAVAGAAYAINKIVEPIAEKSRGFFETDAESIPGSLQSLRSVDKSASELAAEGLQQTQGGTISAAENDRRLLLLRWWDYMWS